jgi:hypothetical protein
MESFIMCYHLVRIVLGLFVSLVWCTYRFDLCGDITLPKLPVNFVVDSNDCDYVVEARDELHWILNEAIKCSILILPEWNL